MRGMDQWRNRLGMTGDSTENPHIEPLTPESARTVRLPWLSHFSAPLLAEHVARNPGMAAWVPATNEYIVAEQWRRRDDIANILEVTARKGKAALVTRLLDDLHSSGNKLALLSEDIWRAESRFYTDLGFSKLQTIVFFEKQLSSAEIASVAGSARLPALEYSLFSPADLDTLLRLDHNSFPWLWWNSREEFEGYMLMPGVHVLMGLHRGEFVGYASFTMYQSWAHLDRLAVIQERQGQGFGAAQLVHCLGRMVELGARSVGLSTQATNLQSHRLYNRFGFRQTREHMHFYGIKLDPSVEIA